MKPQRLFFLVVILAGLGAAFLLPEIQKKKTPLPDPNGLDYYLNAANLLNTRQPSVELTNVDVIRAHLASNQETLRQLHLGLGFHCVVPPEHCVNFPPSDLPLLKRLSLLLRAEGDLALAEKRTHDAVKAYLDGIRFGQEVSRGVLIYDLVGISFEFNAMTALLQSRNQLNEADRTFLLDQLSILRTNREPFSAVSEREMTLMRLNRRGIMDALAAPILWYKTRPAFKKTEDKGFQNIARLELLRTDLVLRQFHERNQRWPANLSDLKLNPSPIDPYSQNRSELRYAPEGAAYLLYSLGPDRKNDGGDSMKDVRLESKFLGRSNQ